MTDALARPRTSSSQVRAGAITYSSLLPPSLGNALREKRRGRRNLVWRSRRSVQPFRHDCFHLPADLHRSVCDFAAFCHRATEGGQRPKIPGDRRSFAAERGPPRKLSFHFTAASGKTSSPPGDDAPCAQARRSKTAALLASARPSTATATYDLRRR